MSRLAPNAKVTTWIQFINNKEGYALISHQQQNNFHIGAKSGFDKEVKILKLQVKL